MNFKQLLLFFAFLVCAHFNNTFAQEGYWQQAVKYTMEIDMDVDKHSFTGVQKIRYTNNSPDTIHKAFYHLYLNAFQPNSMMDVRSRTIADADKRVADRIQKLKEDEQGIQSVQKLTQDGMPTSFSIEGTILEVKLAKAIAPGATTELEMHFTTQVPLQIRRTGRDNAEGVSYSMSQWYPKLAEYDTDGWHPNPYVGREFYGIWGDFDVKITIDKDYTVGASGYIQNAAEVGAGFNGDKAATATGDKKTYHFIAPNVHDFAWGADPDYKHEVFERKNGMKIHCFYQPGEKTSENWSKLASIMDVAFDFINENYGEYPYDQYSFIQGGDGGMEYPMATLITGERTLSSLVGVSVHELMHSWYQMILGTNESLYPWMDEGFTSYTSDEVMNHLRSKGLIPGDVAEDPHIGDLSGFINFASAELDEALSTHADHFTTNAAYGVGSYVKGAIFLHQIRYIVGEEAFKRIMLRYFDTWKFKHPDVFDFIRIAEKESDMVLDWFQEYFVNTRHLADYSISSLTEGKKKTSVLTLEKLGVMPMPVDLTIELKNGEKVYYTIPLRIMRGEKTQEMGMQYELAADWPWTHPTYELVLDIPFKKITRITIDESKRMLDTDRSNNTYNK